MRNLQQKELPYGEWPPSVQQRWEDSFRKAGFLEEGGSKAHLSDATRTGLKRTYGRFLGFLAHVENAPLDQPPALPLDRETIRRFVDYRRRSCQDCTIANELRDIKLVLGIIYPEADFGWIAIIAKRIRAQAAPRQERHHLVTSETLYKLGFDLMDRAMEEVQKTGHVSRRAAITYRDGLMIVMLAAIPLRRRTFAALKIGKQLIRSGELWALDIGPEDTKTRRAIDFPISPALCARIDRYIIQFRAHFAHATQHDGLWVSNKGGALDGGTISETVSERTRVAFGFRVNLHRFRHAAATFWSIRDPKNVSGAKDLLGHVSFGMTEKHYNMAQSRIAGRVLANIWEKRGR
jgi:integrase